MDNVKTAKIRLYVEHPLGQGQSVPFTRDQAHYLFGVMRLGVGAHVLLFDGQNGEFLARITEAGKRGGMAHVESQTKPMLLPPDLWLVFAPIKKARTDFIVEKATEMGAARIVPMQTEFTNAGRIQQARLAAHALEAAEQCGGTYVPEVADLVKFGAMMSGWDPARQIMFCDEALVGDTGDLPDIAGPWAIFIGPEGGFSDAERRKLRGLEYAHPVPLGPRILRADTAAVAAMTLWQRRLGDWGS